MHRCIFSFTGLLCEDKQPCAPTFYGANCTVQCSAPNSCSEGHFQCNSRGDKSCLPGWGPIETCTQKIVAPVFDSDCPVSTGCLNGGSCFNGSCCCSPSHTGKTRESRALNTSANVTCSKDICVKHPLIHVQTIHAKTTRCVYPRPLAIDVSAQVLSTRVFRVKSIKIHASIHRVSTAFVNHWTAPAPFDASAIRVTPVSSAKSRSTIAYLNPVKIMASVRAWPLDSFARACRRSPDRRVRYLWIRARLDPVRRTRR